jgi:hypothetical protein
MDDVMQSARTKPGFVSLFLGGFAIGAAGLLGVQAVQADQPGIIPSAHAATR